MKMLVFTPETIEAIRDPLTDSVPLFDTLCRLHGSWGRVRADVNTLYENEGFYFHYGPRADEDQGTRHLVPKDGAAELWLLTNLPAGLSVVEAVLPPGASHV